MSILHPSHGFDIVTRFRYDVDGIHFDDYFYPYPTDEDFPDNATYSEYLASGGNMTRDDWRRDNINTMIERAYRVVEGSGHRAVFSVSPGGLYRPGDPEGMPPPIQGSNGYETIYADTKWWLQQGWMDMFIPQIYWEIDPPEQSYPIILDWWLDVNNVSIPIFAGNAIYKLLPEERDWPPEEIPRQIEISRDPERREKHSLGNVAFSAKYYRDNTKNITDIYRDEIYTGKATVPTKKI